MANVTFEDYTMEVQAKIADCIEPALEECAGEVISQTKRNSRFDTGQTKNSFMHRVSGSVMAGEWRADMGSNDENAIWEELGTGEHALPEGGGGRSGYWVFVKGEGRSSKRTGKTYTLEEAKRVMAILRSKGLDAYYTNGKKPSRAFFRAYTALKNKLIKRLQDSLKGMG